MAQAHGDRLTAVDASFLAQEGADLAHARRRGDDLRGPAARLRRTSSTRSAARLHLVPRYRQKLAFPPLETGRPLWVDDPSFNLEYHVRHTALPTPGSEEQLRALAARIHSQQLDRSKPLWEMWLVQGLEDDRFALISKTHHALVDGIAGVDLATVLFDLQPVPAGAPAPRASRGARSPSRPPLDLAARGIRGIVRTPFELAGRARRRGAPADARRSTSTREAVEGVGEVAWATLNPAPETPLNVDDRPAPAASCSCARSSRTSSSSRTRSAGPSTTSC